MPKNWLCHVCWKPIGDQCFICKRNICDEHKAKTLFGPKTKLEWYLCPDCFKTGDLAEYMKQVEKEDEEFWLEDQEQEEETKIKETPIK